MRQLDKETKEMQGTYEPSREVAVVVYSDYDRVPPGPENWPEEAKVIWKEVWSLLKHAGYMSKAFTMSVRALSWAAYRRQLAESRLIALPADATWEKILDTNTKTMERLCSKFGLNPTDLYKVPAVKKDEAKTMSLLK